MSRLVEILYLSRLVSRYIGVTEQHSISLRYYIVEASAYVLCIIHPCHLSVVECGQVMSAGVLIRRSPKQFEVTAYELLIVMRIVAFESSDEVAPQFVEFAASFYLFRTFSRDVAPRGALAVIAPVPLLERLLCLEQPCQNFLLPLDHRTRCSATLQFFDSLAHLLCDAVEFPREPLTCKRIPTD